jgi:dipeptidyl aminopeptidase/acylaminoacyl peptidase
MIFIAHDVKSGNRTSGLKQLLVTVLLAAVVAPMTATLASEPSLPGSSSTSPSHTMLPLRGETLLKRLLRPMPAIYAISVSPDGSKIAYFETVLQRFRTGMFSNSVSMNALYVVYVSNGKTIELPLGSLKEEMREFPRSSPVLQWSHDSMKLATLVVVKDKPHLIEWKVETHTPGAIIPLKDSPVAPQPGEKIDSWSWLSASRKLVIGITSARPLGGSASITDNSKQPIKPTDVWYMSRAPAWLTTVAQTRGFIPPIQQMRLAIVNLLDGEWQLVRNTDDATPFDEQALVLTDAAEDPSHPAPLRLLQQREWVQGRLGALGVAGGPTQGFATLWRLNPTTAVVRRLYVSPNSRIYAAAMTRDRTHLVITEGESLLEGDPYQWPAPGVLTRLLFGHVRALPMGAVDAQTIDPELTETFMSVLLTSDRPQVIYEVSPSGTESRIFELYLPSAQRTAISPPHLSVSFADVSADGRVIAAVLENLNTPSEIYVRTGHNGPWRKLTDYAKQIGDLGTGKFEKITWPSRDGRFLLEGLLLKPPGFNPTKKYPLIVLAHGGQWPSFLNMFGFLGAMDGTGSAILPYALADDGYLVLQPNYRGTSGYSAEFAEPWKPEQWYEDIDAGTDAVIQRGWADPKQVGIMGHSAGSAPLNYALLHQERYRAAVNNDGVFLLPELYQLLAPAPQFNKDPTFQQDAVRDPPVDADRFRVPLLIRWSDLKSYLKLGNTPLGPNVGDDIQDMTTKKLRYLMAKNDVPFEVIMDQDQHVVMDPTYLLEYQSRILQWFDYFVRGKGANPIPAMDSPLGYVQWTGETAP